MAEDASVPEVRLEKGDGGAPDGPRDRVPPPLQQQETIASFPEGTPAPLPPAPPSDPTPGPRTWVAPAAPPTPTPSVPSPGPYGSYPPPAAPANPFAPPQHPLSSLPPSLPLQDGAVPPPPMAPDGPGQLAYGYPAGHGYPPPQPGGYGHPAQPGGYGYPAHHPGGPGPYGWAGMRPDSNGMGMASLVCGIVAAAGFCLWPLAIVLGVLAVIFGVIGRAKAKRGEASNPGHALAGIICGAAGFALGVGMVVLLVVA